MSGVYGVNFHAQELRQHQTPNRVRFGAPDDATASAIAAVLQAAVVSQQTSLVKRVASHNLGSTHPAGTAYTAKAVLVGGGTSAYTVRLRNLKNTSTAYADLAALFGGTASTAVTALSAPPTLPSNGQAVSRSSVTIIKRY